MNDELVHSVFDRLLQTKTLEEITDILDCHPWLLSEEADATLKKLIKDIRRREGRQKARDYKWLRGMLIDIRRSQPPFLIEINQIKNLEARFAQTGDSHLLDEAVALWGRVFTDQRFRKVSEELHISVLNDSANTLVRRYRVRREIKDIDLARSRLERVLELLPDPSDKRMKSLANLSEIHRICFEVRGMQDDLESAVSYARQSVEHADRNRTDFVPAQLNLGNALYAQYELTRRTEFLDEALDILRRTISTTDESQEELCLLLCSLGNCLSARFERTERRDDLDKAIAAYRMALRRPQVGGFEYTIIVNELASALSIRFERFGSMDDLTEAQIQLEWCTRNENNGIIHSSRQLIEQAYLHVMCYQANRDPEELKTAIRAIETLLKSPENNASIAVDASNTIGVCYLYLYQEKGRIELLGDCIKVFQQTIKIAPMGFPMLAVPLHNLGSTYLLWYLHEHDLDYLSAAIRMVEQAIKIAPEDKELSQKLMHTRVLCLQAEHDADPNENRLCLAVEAYRDVIAASSSYVSGDVLEIARNWLRWAFDRKNWSEVEEVYGHLSKCLNSLLPAQLLRSSKETWLGRAQGAASLAAFAYVMKNKPEQAVMTLEQAQARLLRESFASDRQLLSQLKLIGYEALHDRFQVDSSQLQDITQRIETRALGLTSELIPAANEGSVLEKLRVARTNLDQVINEIRQLQGFEEFFQPPNMEVVRKAAESITIVYLASTQYGGFALVVDRSDDGCACIQLPDLRAQEVSQNAQSILDAIRRHMDEDTWWRELDRICGWLWDAAMSELVKYFRPDIEIALVPVGKLNLFPFHAAWIDDPRAPNGRRYALDTLTISYTPSAQALASAAKQAGAAERRRFLGVSTPGSAAAPLSQSRQQVAMLAACFENVTMLDCQKVSGKCVLGQLAQHDVIHFSCHGKADQDNPLSSRLMLYGEDIVTLDQLLRLQGEGFRMVTLSACESGLSDTKLPEEFVSFATGFLAAHAACVVAPFWAVEELSTLLLMTRYYHEWTRNGQTPARSLQVAQKWVRDSSFSEKLDFLREAAPDQEVWEVLAEAFSSPTSRDKINFQHPYFWAAFTCLGI